MWNLKKKTELIEKRDQKQGLEWGEIGGRGSKVQTPHYNINGY